MHWITGCDKNMADMASEVCTDAYAEQRLLNNDELKKRKIMRAIIDIMPANYDYMEG